MTSKVEICNLALMELGDDYTITSLTADGTNAANACNLVYEPAKNYLLRRYIWNFAKARAELAETVATPAFEYSKQFQLPSGFRRLVEINGEEHYKIRHAIEGDKLLMDEAAAKVIFCQNIDDVTLFDPIFVIALSQQIASMVAYKLTGSRSLQADMYAKAQETAGEAMEADAQDAPEKLIEFSDRLNSREGDVI